MIEVYIPSNITYIAPGAFDHLHLLMFIEVAEDNPAYYSEDGILYAADGEIIAYLLIVIILSFLFAQIPLSYFRRRTLQEAIKGNVVTTRPYLFRKIGIIMQFSCQSCFYLLCGCYDEATLFSEKYGLRNGTP